MANVPSGAAPAAVPTALPPFRPSCIMCVSDCDSESIFTSCHHFVCSRCVAKYPQGVCPRCRTPCRALRVSAPNVAERIGGDAAKVMQQSLTMLDFQRRQEFNTTQRLKEMVSLFNGQLRTSAAKTQELQAENDRLKAESGAAAQAIQALEAKIHQLQQQQQQQPPPLQPASYATSMMMPPRTTHQLMPQHNTGFSPGTAASIFGGDPHHHHQLQQQQQQQASMMQQPSMNNWMSPCRPPTAVMGSGDVAALFGAAPKRGRSETGVQGGGLPPSPADRFVLATPAMTLRGPPPPLPMPNHQQTQQQVHHHVNATAPRLQSMLPTSNVAPPVVRLIHSSSGHSAPFKPG